MLALTMWSRNGTVEWINSLSEDKKNELIEEARTQYPAMKQKYEKRKVELKEAKYQKMLKKQQEQKDKEDRQSVKKMNVCNALVDNNINAWISCEQATENLKDISVEKRAAGM